MSLTDHTDTPFLFLQPVAKLIAIHNPPILTTMFAVNSPFPSSDLQIAWSTYHNQLLLIPFRVVTVLAARHAITSLVPTCVVLSINSIRSRSPTIITGFTGDFLEFSLSKHVCRSTLTSAVSRVSRRLADVEKVYIQRHVHSPDSRRL
jgi:hypothetical protein